LIYWFAAESKKCKPEQKELLPNARISPKVTKAEHPGKDAVRHALSEQLGFVSAGQLHLVLKNHGSTIGLATVYRALGDLVETGDADALTSGDGELIYRACASGTTTT
jgi:Fe2+ or Zn2+ uptake regulation protein